MWFFFSLHWNENAFNLLFILHTIPFFSGILEFSLRKTGKIYSDFVVQNMFFSLHIFTAAAVHSFHFRVTISIWAEQKLNEWQRFVVSFQNKQSFFFLRDLKRFIVDLSLCRMQYAINVCYDYFFYFVNSGNVSRLLLVLSLSACLFCVCVQQKRVKRKVSDRGETHAHENHCNARARVCNTTFQCHPNQIVSLFSGDNNFFHI